MGQPQFPFKVIHLDVQAGIGVNLIANPGLFHAVFRGEAPAVLS